MSSQTKTVTTLEPLDLSKWRIAPVVLMVVGLVAVGLGFAIDKEGLTQFAFSWLLAFMFFLSLGLGSLGFVILHHLFDAGWSVPIRRVMEQLSCSILRWVWLLWIPIGALSPRLYEWIRKVNEGAPDLATKAKMPLFTIPGFWITSIICLALWFWLPTMLRKFSLKQDETGSPEWTRKMRKYSAFGVFIFGFSLTLGAIMWVKALEHEWFSTMYGVYYFAGSMWMTMATLYVIVLLLQRQGPLRQYVHEKTYYFMGSILFAFTVFYAYVTFAQYFIIWNANMPEETFWYVIREKGTWWDIGLIIIFGHFFVPFLLLLRIDWKLKLALMGPLFVWVWLMHFVDMSFNIGPVLHGDNYHLDLMDIGCMAFFCGLLSKIFLMNLYSSPIVPQKDPRFAESQEIYVPPASGGHNVGSDQFIEAATARGTTHAQGGKH